MYPLSYVYLPPILKKSLWGRGTVVAATVDEGILRVSAIFNLPAVARRRAIRLSPFFVR